MNCYGSEVSWGQRSQGWEARQLDCRAPPRIGLWTEPKADAEGAWRRNWSLLVMR